MSERKSLTCNGHAGAQYHWLMKSNKLNIVSIILFLSCKMELGVKSTLTDISTRAVVR